MKYAYIGNIEFGLKLADAHCASHQGQCDEDVAAVSRLPYVQRQLAKFHPLALAAALREYGCWDDAELLNHRENCARLVWIAAGDIVEEA